MGDVLTKSGKAEASVGTARDRHLLGTRRSGWREVDSKMTCLFGTTLKLRRCLFIDIFETLAEIAGRSEAVGIADIRY